MKALLEKVKTLGGLGSDRETWLMLAICGAGWLYYLYQYLFASGLAVAIPRYAGY